MITRDPRLYEPCACCGVWTLAATMDDCNGLLLRGRWTCPECTDALAREANEEHDDGAYGRYAVCERGVL